MIPPPPGYGAGKPSRILRRRARKSGKYLIVKRRRVWWKITPTGICQPCSSWRIATQSVPWNRRKEIQ